MTKPACKDCRFWERHPDASDSDGAAGKCRVNAPLFSAARFLGQWPLTLGTDWCGEFKEPSSVAMSNDYDEWLNVFSANSRLNRPNAPNRS